MNKKSQKYIILFLSCVLLLFSLFTSIKIEYAQEANEITYSQLINDAKKALIKDVSIVNNKVYGIYKNGNKFTSTVHNVVNEIAAKLTDYNVNVSFDQAKNNGVNFFISYFISMFHYLLPTMMFMLFLAHIHGLFDRKNRFKSQIQIKTSFADIAGLEEEKSEVLEIVDFLKNPKKYQKLGGVIPAGILLIGPPGNGKTLLAKAIAGEAGVMFFYASGSDFVEKYVGVGAARIRAIFEQALAHAPCIIFIDELDSIGSTRSNNSNDGAKEYDRTLNQLLTEMDGFKPNSGVIVICATNRPEILDAALLRRLTRKIYVPFPDLNNRTLILEHYAKKIKIDEDVNMKDFAKLTQGFSSSALSGMLNDAALLAARKNQDLITKQDINEARERGLLGLERKHMIITLQEKWITAYHESGHAIVAAFSKHSDAIHKITIAPRGQALGMVVQLSEDRVSTTLAMLKAQLKIIMGGRAAELIKYGEDYITTGAASDLYYATNLAKKIVYKGLSAKLGPIDYSEYQDIPESYKHSLMEETQRLIMIAQDEAVRIITENAELFELLATTLMEKETISGEEFEELRKKVASI